MKCKIRFKRDTQSGGSRTEIPVESGHFFRGKFGHKKIKDGQQTDMRKVRGLLQLKYEQGQSARCAAKAVGMDKTAASEYIARFSVSALTLGQALALPDAELSGILSLKVRTTNERYQKLSGLFSKYEKELTRTGVTLHLL